MACWNQAMIWTNAGILLIVPLVTNFSEILIGIYTFAFMKVHLKMTQNRGHFVSASINVVSGQLRERDWPSWTLYIGGTCPGQYEYVLLSDQIIKYKG